MKLPPQTSSVLTVQNELSYDDTNVVSIESNENSLTIVRLANLNDRNKMNKKQIKEQELLKEMNSVFPGWSIAGHPYTDDVSLMHEHFYVTYSARYDEYRVTSNVITSEEDILKGYSDVSATAALADLKEQIKEQLDLLQSIYDSMERKI